MFNYDWVIHMLISICSKTTSREHRTTVTSSIVRGLKSSRSIVTALLMCSQPWNAKETPVSCFTSSNALKIKLQQLPLTLQNQSSVLYFRSRTSITNFIFIENDCDLSSSSKVLSSCIKISTLNT